MFGARSHTPADGLLEVAENAAEDRERQARAHAAFRDQG